MRRRGAGRAKAGEVGRGGHPVQVGTIVVAIGVENSDTRWDDMMWEVHEEDNVAVGEAVCCHECIEIRARDRQHVTSGTIKVPHDGILLVALVCVEVDVAKRCRARRRLYAKDDFGNLSQKFARGQHSISVGVDRGSTIAS
jgi:hypothetical protein